MINFNNQPQDFTFFKTALSRLNATQRNATQRKFNSTPSLNGLLRPKSMFFFKLLLISLLRYEHSTTKLKVPLCRHLSLNSCQLSSQRIVGCSSCLEGQSSEDMVQVRNSPLQSIELLSRVSRLS
jgi:hypothetical protein